MILADQARKYNVGMVLAHQFLGQLEPKLQEAFAANTTIKFADGVSAKDARALAPMLYCNPELIEAQAKGSFAAHVRGQTKGAVPLSFPFGFMEAMPRMDETEHTMLRQTMRDRYAIHYSELGKTDSATGPSSADESEHSKSDEPKPVQSARPRKLAKEDDADQSSGHIDNDAGESW